MCCKIFKRGENHFKKHSTTNICEHFNFIHLIHTILQRIGPGEGQVHGGEDDQIIGGYWYRRPHAALGELDDKDIGNKRLPGFRRAGVLVSFSQSVVLVD